MGLARQAMAIAPRTCPSPWPGFEHARGYAVMIVPFSSGHRLGLRVFPETDFAPYVSLWHQPPGDPWNIYNDGASLETTCPRWWGPALGHAALAPINVTWTGPNELTVEMDKPRLSWRMRMSAPGALPVLNGLGAAMPLWTWKPAPLRRAREAIAEKYLGLGRLRFDTVTPSRQAAVIMAEQFYLIDASSAVLNGTDLGEVVRLDDNPVIGETPLPRRASFVIGQAHGRIKDMAEYRRTRAWAASRECGRNKEDVIGAG